MTKAVNIERGGLQATYRVKCFTVFFLVSVTTGLANSLFHRWGNQFRKESNLENE